MEKDEFLSIIDKWMVKLTLMWMVKKVEKVFIIETWITNIHQSYRQSWTCGSIHNYSHK